MVPAIFKFKFNYGMAVSPVLPFQFLDEFEPNNVCNQETGLHLPVLGDLEIVDHKPTFLILSEVSSEIN